MRHVQEICWKTEPTCSSTETGGRTVTSSRRASAGSARARQPISGAADNTVPPELAQCESLKLTERLLGTLAPSEPAFAMVRGISTARLSMTLAGRAIMRATTV